LLMVISILISVRIEIRLLNLPFFSKHLVIQRWRLLIVIMIRLVQF